MQLIANAKAQFIDQNGAPLAGGSVGFYFPGTLNPKNTYQDQAGTIANTNPVLLDSRGQALIWGIGNYRQIVKDANGVTIWDQVTEAPSIDGMGNFTDEVFVAGDGIAPNTFVPGTTTTLTLAGTYGSADNLWVDFDLGPQHDFTLNNQTLGFPSPIPVGVENVYVKGGIATPILAPSSGSVTDSSVASGSKLFNRINDIHDVKDFGAKGDGVTDDTAAIKAAITYVNGLGGGIVFFPAGTYLVSSSMVFSNFANIWLQGAGAACTIIEAATAGTFTNGLISMSGGSNFKYCDITFNVNNKPVGTLIPAVFFASATDIEVSDCEVLHMSTLGIGTSVCSNIRILRNKIVLDVAFNSQNNGILISGVSNNVWLDSNDINRTNIIAAATNCWITNNDIYNYKYGAGVGVTGGTAGESGPYYVIGNTCSGGTGIDTDGTYVAGMEFNGVGGICANNTCFNNSGVGIASFSYGSAITGNVCYNNGTGGSAAHCAGILGAFQAAGQFFANNVVSGNTCFDSGAGTQKYGYQDVGDTRCTNNTFAGNNFEHNVTSPFSMTSLNSVQGATYEGTVAYAGGTLPNNSQATFTVNVGNVAIGDFAIGSYSTGLGGLAVTANVNTPGTVAVTVTNLSGSSVVIPAGTWRAKVLQHYL